MPTQIEGELSAADLRIAIVAAKFSRDIVDQLLSGALKAIADAGGDVDSIPVARVPGSLELAVAARKFAVRGDIDAVICLGCVIQGETSHYDCVVDGARQGIVSVATNTGVPVIFGVLTCDNHEQAQSRADASKKLNTGAYAANAAIEMANLLKSIES